MEITRSNLYNLLHKHCSAAPKHDVNEPIMMTQGDGQAISATTIPRPPKLCPYLSRSTGPDIKTMNSQELIHSSPDKSETYEII